MPVIHVGAVGQSVWRSDDGGTSFRIRTKGMWAESDIRALTTQPGHGETVYAGSDSGVYKSTDSGGNWELAGSELVGQEIWSIGVSRQDRELVVAGTCPGGRYKTEDGGQTWSEGEPESEGDAIAQSCFDGAMKTRITTILMHPEKRDTIYAGVEADGPRRSNDGGRTWHRIGLDDVDVHDIKRGPGGTLFLSSNYEIFRSDDDGDTWEPLHIADHFRHTYCRGMAFSPTAPRVLYVSNGSGPPGNTGSIYRTRNRGESWERVDVNGDTNSSFWQFARGDEWMLASTVLGQVFRSTDGGENWGKLAWEFGEIRGLVCVG